MKKSLKILLLCCVTGIVLFGVTLALAVDPGTDGDPLVSVSYIQSKVLSYIDTQIQAVKDYVDLKVKNGGGAGTGAPASSFEVIKLESGQQFIGDEGCEVILRSGAAKIVSSQAELGVSDVTEGADLLNGETVARNHLMIVPRSDGRGLIAQNEVYLMVKGNYILK